jgi:pyridoxal phosphate enzyme (YggS family)
MLYNFSDKREINLEYTLDNLKKIMYNIEDAKSKYRKSTETVRLMAVTKTVSPDRVNVAIDGGVDLLGENRVQEFLSKADSYKPAEIHFIGSLQSNKVRQIVGKVSCIQSLDSVKLAKEINTQSEKNGVITDVLIEVNIGNEDSKGGVSQGELRGLAESVKELENIRFRGLMAIPPPFAPENLYGELQKLYERTKSDYGIDTLSVGMSDDYTTAIKYGSTLVRIGSGLFGKRDYGATSQ